MDRRSMEAELNEIRRLLAAMNDTQHSESGDDDGEDWEKMDMNPEVLVILRHRWQAQRPPTTEATMPCERDSQPRNPAPGRPDNSHGIGLIPLPPDGQAPQGPITRASEKM